jgi:aryl-alcohol dehydrogenase-like predicted oxidoreductase
MTIERIKLGSSDLEVPRICLGTMTFGEQNTEVEAHQQLDWALDNGINFIDTAEMYPVPTKAETFTRTESIVGRWLSTKDRSKVILATKIAGPGRGMAWVRKDQRLEAGPLTRDDFILACDASLKRLQTDVIDLYQIHWPTRNMPLFGSGRFDGSKDYDCASIDEQLEAMERLKRAGKVKHFGVSNETAWGVGEFVKIAEKYGLPKIASIQNIYNLMAREYELSLTETCHHEKVGLLAYSPLAFGLLTGKYRNGEKPSGARLTLFGNLCQAGITTGGAGLRDACSAMGHESYPNELGVLLSQPIGGEHHNRRHQALTVERVRQRVRHQAEQRAVG